MLEATLQTIPQALSQNLLWKYLLMMGRYSQNGLLQKHFCDAHE